MIDMSLQKEFSSRLIRQIFFCQNADTDSYLLTIYELPIGVLQEE